jgi:hypothetical protein
VRPRGTGLGPIGDAKAMATIVGGDVVVEDGALSDLDA